MVAWGASMPWVRVGRVDRSAFALARWAQNVGVVDGPYRRAAVIALFITPALAGLLVIALSLSWHRFAAGTACLVAFVGLGAGGIMSRVSRQLQPGPIVTLVGGAASLVAAFGLLRVRRRFVANSKEHSPRSQDR